MSRLRKYLNEKNYNREKGGILPFYISNGNIEIMLIKPSNPAYGGSDYQMAKGRQDTGENIETTAKREGKEELGLKFSNVEDFFFVDSDIIKDYKLTIYAVKVKNKDDFNKTDKEIKTRSWLNLKNIKIRREQKRLLDKILKTIQLKYKNINEWKVNKSYSGRSMIKPNSTILWQYIPSKGLVYTLPDGTTYVNNKKIGKMVRSDDPKATHKKQLASFYSELGFKDKDKRQYIEDIYETFVRGRIVDKNIYVYSSDYVGIEAKKYNRTVDKTIDMIYKYVDEDYNINEKYYKRFENFGESFEIFKNPSLKELRELAKADSIKKVRFFADNNTKTTWVWPWNGKNHIGMLKQNLSNVIKKDYNDPTLFSGISDIRGNVTGNDELEFRMRHSERDFVDILISIDWRWARPFKIAEYLEDIGLT